MHTDGVIWRSLPMVMGLALLAACSSVGSGDSRDTSDSAQDIALGSVLDSEDRDVVRAPCSSTTLRVLDPTTGEETGAHDVPIPSELDQAAHRGRFVYTSNETLANPAGDVLTRDATLVSVDLDTGRFWQRVVGGFPELGVAGDDLVVSATLDDGDDEPGSDGAFVIDALTGEALELLGPLGADESPLFGGRGGRVGELDHPESPLIVPFDERGAPRSWASDEVARYVTTADVAVAVLLTGHVVAYRIEDGEELWRTPTTGAVPDGLVWIGVSEGRVLVRNPLGGAGQQSETSVFDLATGERRSIFSGFFPIAPVGRDFVALVDAPVAESETSSATRVARIDDTGEVVWSLDDLVVNRNEIRIAGPDAEVIWMSADDQGLVAVDADSGAAVRLDVEENDSDDLRFRDVIAIDDDAILVGRTGVARVTRDGTVLWSTPIDEFVQNGLHVTVVDDRLVAVDRRPPGCAER